MTADSRRHRPAWGPVTASYHRRNRFLARLGLCAAGGLVLGGVLAIPFSGSDDPATLSTATTAVTTTVGSNRTSTPASLPRSPAATTVVTTVAAGPTTTLDPSTSSDPATGTPTTIASGVA